MLTQEKINNKNQTWDFPYRYVEGMDPYIARFADANKRLAFEVRSASPLGVIMGFEQSLQGYILTFSLGDKIRAIWIDSSGTVLNDVTLPNGLYTEVNFDGQATVSQDGSLYMMSSTERGIEIHYVCAP
jgi:hypothetical protein